MGHSAVLTPFSRNWQYFPWPLRSVPAPRGTEIILVSSWNGFAFRRQGRKLVVVSHSCVFDPAFAPYRSPLQVLFHESAVRRYERASLKAADAVVAVSAYTARVVQKVFGIPKPEVILNGVDTDFFCPAQDMPEAGVQQPLRLLFVGRLTRGKGADLLPRIMARLGRGFELRYTCGLRNVDPFAAIPNMKPLGRLTLEGVRDAYRQADLVLFPTRLEGFGYAAAEAMACGRPVIASGCMSLPEIVEDGVTGRLCPVDDVDAFTSAIRALAADRDKLRAMGERARAVAIAKFSRDRWTNDYLTLFKTVAEQS